MLVNADLYQRILDQPEEDAPRLVYADWLEEQGEAGRAEFIRAQCQLARLSAADPQREDLLLRSAALLEAHRSEWNEEVPRWARDQVEFERGFVDLVRCSPSDWVRGAKGLLRRVPLQRLQLGRMATGFEEMLRHPPTAHLTGLRFDPQALPAGSLSTLAAAPTLAGLRSLSFNSCQIGAAGAGLLSTATTLSRLTRLDLNRNRLTDAAVAALCAAPMCGSLTHLALSLNELSAQASAALAQSRLARQLEHLDLSMNRLGDEGVSALTQGPFERLRWLYLAHNQLLDAAEALAECPALSGLEGLDLSANALGGAGLRALARSPYLHALRWLDLHDNQIDSDWLEVVRDSPLLDRLTTLNLSWNQLADPGVRVVLSSPRLQQLARLELAVNQVGVAGMETLAAANFTTLRHLDLHGNGFGDEGVKRLFASPGLQTVRTLNLNNTNVGAEGIRALQHSPHLGSLRILYLSNNPLGDAGATALLDWQGSGLLARLDVIDTGMSAAMQQTLRDRLGRAVQVV